MLQRISRPVVLWTVLAVAVIAVVIAIAVNAASDGDSPTAAPPTSTKTPFTPPPTVSPSAPKPTGPTAVPERPKKQTVDIDETATVTNGTKARLVKITRVNGKAELPGEIGGPAISVQVSVRAGEKLDFDQTVVNAYYGNDDTPAFELSNGTKPLTGTLAGGRTAVGTYVFSLPKAGLGNVTIELDLDLDKPVTLFVGAVS